MMKVVALIIATFGIVIVLAAGMLTAPVNATDTPGPVSCTVGPSSSAGSNGQLRLSPPQMSVVAAILATAKGMGVRARGATIALQTAMQESTLRANVAVGQAVGAFQQIAPGPDHAYAGYDRTDAGSAAKGFFVVLLKRVPQYETDPRPNHELAQVVQASGAGADEYAKHQGWAEAVVADLFSGSSGSLNCVDQSVKGPISVQIKGNTVVLPPEARTAGTVVARTPQAAKAIGAALAWLGTTYAWGGGDADGPTQGQRDNGGAADAHGDYAKVGFDCSGLTLHAYAQAGVQIIRPADAQLTRAKLVVPFSAAEPGDLLFWGAPAHHVAMYLGLIDGMHRMVEAPQSGDVVKVSPVRLGGDFRGVAARPVAGGRS